MAGRFGNLKRLSEWINLINESKTAERNSVLERLARLQYTEPDVDPLTLKTHTPALPEFERGFRRNERRYQDQFRDFDPKINEDQAHFLNDWVDDSGEALDEHAGNLGQIADMLDEHSIPVGDPVWRGGHARDLEKYTHYRPYSFTTNPGTALDFAGHAGTPEVPGGQIIHARPLSGAPPELVPRYFPVPHAGEEELLSPLDSRFLRLGDDDEVTRALWNALGQRSRHVPAELPKTVPMVRVRAHGGIVE